MKLLLTTMFLLVTALHAHGESPADDVSDHARAEMLLPRGTFSLGVIGSGVFPIMTSDVVGPDAPEGSHERTTTSAGLMGGIEAAWEFHRKVGLIVSLRTRIMTFTSLDVEAQVHEHVDLATIDGITYRVTTDHGVRHVARRTDVQGLVGVELVSIPLRFIGGMSFMVSGVDRIEETFNELSREIVQNMPGLDDHDDALAVHDIRDRMGLIVGIEIPLRFKRMEVSVHAVTDIGVSMSVQDNIPTASHALSAGMSCAWRF